MCDDMVHNYSQINREKDNYVIRVVKQWLQESIFIGKATVRTCVM